MTDNTHKKARFIKDRDLRQGLDSLGVTLHAYRSIGSTNSEAKRYAAEKIDRAPALFIAGEQTAGRGRVGRSFISRRGRGIYMTLLYFTESELYSATSVTGAAAVATALAIEQVTGKEMKIKWVNDIYNGQGKVCGILTEAVRCEDCYAIAVGIGINIGEGEMPEELRGIASSIGAIEGRETELILSIVKGLLDHVKEPDKERYVPEYKKRLMLVGENVNILRGGMIVGCGTVVGVDDDLGLIIDTPRGREIMYSGEISIRKQ